MKISGFTIVRNAEKLYYPIKAAIESILPICDEFIVVIGEGDDNTEEIVKSINSDKIKIINTVWDFTNKGHVYADQTNIALDNCTGDWCFYIQADEVIHEKYLLLIKDRCHELLDDKDVEALVLNFRHFWGDYDHYQTRHGWYKKEVRIVRNNIGINSHGDAQGFRKNITEKPKAALVNAEVFHYGWVRPPHYMQSKDKTAQFWYWGDKTTTKTRDFDYGPIGNLPVFRATHPEVMQEWLDRFNWKDKLNYEFQKSPFYKDDKNINRKLMKFEKKKRKILSKIEEIIRNKSGINLNLSAHKNYRIINGK